MPPSALIDLDRELVRRGGLYAFSRLAWPLIDPAPFVPNWHLEELSAYLQAVSSGEIRNLVINVPPGTGKSHYTSIFWPCWDWISNPQRAWFFGSYDDQLVYRDAAKSISLLRSRWFVERWGNLLPGAKTPNVSDFRTPQGGHRFGSTPRGKVTGHHFDILSIDDPIKPIDASGGSSHSTAVLDMVREWMWGTLPTRVRNAKTSARVLTMQRLHEEDPAGECIDQGWVSLVLPMRHDPERRSVHSIGGVERGERRTEPGELLFPDRFGEAEVKSLEIELGDDAAAQLQQDPKRLGSQVIKSEWITDNYWSSTGIPGTVPLPDIATSVQFLSCDLAFKDEKSSDLVAIGVMLYHGEDIFALELVNERLDLPGSCDVVRRLCAAYPRARSKLVENKANGPALEQTMRHEMGGITLVEPSGGKMARLRASAPAFRAGRVHLRHPSEERHTQEAHRQLTKFPFVKHDDLLDMLTQAVIAVRRHGNAFERAMSRLRGEIK